MIQHSTSQRHPGLNPQGEYKTVLPRTELIPWWMYVMLAFTLLMSLMYAVGCITLISELNSPDSTDIDDTSYRILLFVIVLLCFWISIGCVLLWTRWKHALMYLMIPSCSMSVCMLFSVVGTIKVQHWPGLVFSLIFLSLLIGNAIRLYKIQHEWKARRR